MRSHILVEHNEKKKITTKLSLFSDSVTPLLESGTTKVSPNAGNSSKGSTESSSDGASSTGIRNTLSIGPSRERQPRLQARPTPYQRTANSSSLSLSPVRRSSLGTLSPLQILSPLPHLSPLPAPSPLQQLVYSRPTSPSPRSDDKMDVDEAFGENISFLTDDEVLAKGSFAVIALPHVQIFPPIRLIGCTKCLKGVLASTLLSHAKGHNIILLPNEKRDLQRIIESSLYVNDPGAVPSPNPPCPPIEGIQVHDGLSCNLCSYCCISSSTLVTHFGASHKGAPGHSKANSKTVQLQTFFTCRTKYFAVTSSLYGVNKNDLFAAYMQQCAPEIDAIRILNPPLNVNEVSPLLKVMQWHEHLKDYIKNRDSVRMLLELTKLPTSRLGDSWMGSPLRNTIEGYMRDVRAKANNASLGIRCLLKECPRFVASLMISFKANNLV
jgi:hypothetical protein